jgi:hypothetical protein
MQRRVLLQMLLNSSNGSSNSSATGNSMLLQQQMLGGMLYQASCRLQGVGSSKHTWQRNAQDHRLSQCSSFHKGSAYGHDIHGLLCNSWCCK